MRSTLALAIATHLAEAVTYREDKAVNLYRVASSNYPMVFPFGHKDNLAANAGQHCSATVIGTRFAITAAHCNEPALTLPLTVTIDGSDYKVVEIRQNNCFINENDEENNNADIAILVFDSDITGTPYEVYWAFQDGYEVNKEIEIMGWG